MTKSTSRRSFLTTSAGLAGAAIASGPAALNLAAQEAQKAKKGQKAQKVELPKKTYDLKLGACSYSFRKFSRADCIKMTKQLNTPYINIKEFHLLYKSTPEELAAGRKEFEDAGLIIVGGGTISLQKDDDADMRMYFEYAKAAGMPLMVIAPTKETVPRIEKFVKEYDIKAAIHNHGPEDKHFPSPYDVLEAVQGRDPRMGLCMDVGHTTRTGKDVVKALADAGSRLLDVHIKDLADLMVSGSQCDVGDGVMPVVAIFKQLKKMNFQGYVNLEYEINADAPLVGMQKSFSYMRGVLDALKA
jgi:sugar phosphate isomerase/epimerase